MDDKTVETGEAERLVALEGRTVAVAVAAAAVDFAVGSAAMVVAEMGVDAAVREEVLLAVEVLKVVLMGVGELLAVTAEKRESPVRV